jgi:hypothetical protein
MSPLQFLHEYDQACASPPPIERDHLFQSAQQRINRRLFADRLAAIDAIRLALHHQARHQQAKPADVDRHTDADRHMRVIRVITAERWLDAMHAIGSELVRWLDGQAVDQSRVGSHYFTIKDGIGGAASLALTLSPISPISPISPTLLYFDATNDASLVDAVVASLH